MNIKKLETIKNLPTHFSSEQERRDYYWIILHEINNIVVSNKIFMLTEVKENLEKMFNERVINNELYLSWKHILNNYPKNSDILLEKSEKMQQLRSISPFSIVIKSNKDRKFILDKLYSIKIEKNTKEPIKYLELIE